MLKEDLVELPVDVEHGQGAAAAGVVVVGHAAGIYKSDTMKFVVKGMVSAAKYDAVDLFPKELFWLLLVVGEV